MQFHQRLYEVRKRSGMTQSDLAEKLNVSRQAVSRWEMGTAKPDFENLIAISKLFGVSTDYLLKGEAEEKTASSEPEQQKDENSFNFWEKLWGIVLIAYFVMALLFGIGSGDVMNGLIMPVLILLVLAVIVGIICGATLIVREILKRFK